MLKAEVSKDCEAPESSRVRSTGDSRSLESWRLGVRIRVHPSVRRAKERDWSMVSCLAKPHSSAYSYRNAWIGSSRAALKAGNKPAMTPTAALKATATIIAIGVITGALAEGVINSSTRTKP